MNGLRTLVRLHDRQLDERSRSLAGLHEQRQQLRDGIAKLEDEMSAERIKASNSPDFLFAYPAYSKFASARRDNLRGSMADLQGEIDVLQEEVSEAYGELKRFEIVQEAHEVRARSEENRKEQAELDEVGANMHRRRAKTVNP